MGWRMAIICAVALFDAPALAAESDPPRTRTLSLDGALRDRPQGRWTGGASTFTYTVPLITGDWFSWYVSFIRRTEKGENVATQVRVDRQMWVDAKRGEAVSAIGPDIGPIAGRGFPAVVVDAGGTLHVSFICADGAEGMSCWDSYDRRGGRHAWRYVHRMIHRTTFGEPHDLLTDKGAIRGNKHRTWVASQGAQAIAASPDGQVATLLQPREPWTWSDAGRMLRDRIVVWRQRESIGSGDTRLCNERKRCSRDSEETCRDRLDEACWLGWLEPIGAKGRMHGRPILRWSPAGHWGALLVSRPRGANPHPKSIAGAASVSVFDFDAVERRRIGPTDLGPRLPAQQAAWARRRAIGIAGCR